VVIGADGLRSATRRMLGIALEAQPVGMEIWRLFAPRPPRVTGTELFYGGPCYIAGYAPTSDTTLYAYLTEDAQDRFSTSPDEQVVTVRELSEASHGPWDTIRESMVDGIGGGVGGRPGRRCG
jgi:2-polyprenyl-6-methoxyphenol hydroxylase-like FAD-dependent oxidoreductase